MSDEKQITEATFTVLQSSGGAVPKSALVERVERIIGRKLTPVEAAMSVWRAREQYLSQTGVEVVSSRGALGLATVKQSTSRRVRAARTHVRRLEREGTRALALMRSVEATSEERAVLDGIAGKCREAAAHAAHEMRKRAKKMPEGL
jgi:hypothetical protein